MTLALEKSRSADHRRPAKAWSPDELEALWKLAESLQGRPLPGIRLTETQFWTQYGHEDVKAEWVDGEVVVMAPVSGKHSDLNFWLQRLIAEFVEHHDLGLVRGPEFPMRLAPLRRLRIPDIMFVAKSKLAKTHPTYLDGPADLVVEIVSPDSEARDWRDKYQDYQTSGVREYWVVDPLSNRVDAYVLDRSKQYSQIQPDNAERLHSRVLKGFFVKPEWLWRSPLPKLTVALKELKLR